MEDGDPLRNIALGRAALVVDEDLLRVILTRMPEALMEEKVHRLVQTDREALRKNSGTAPFIPVAAVAALHPLELVWERVVLVEEVLAAQEEIQQLLRERMEAVAAAVARLVELRLLLNMLVLAARVT